MVAVEPRYARARGQVAGIPTQIVMRVDGIDPTLARDAARRATVIARSQAPKLTGRSSKRFAPIWGRDFFGVHYSEPYVWYQEHGINPFTMKNLAGKTIPMWIDDPAGTLRRENPKAKTRTMSGRRQVLIFRRAAKIGQRKRVLRRGQMVDVPASYPGAPGRIANRHAPQPHTATGKQPGGIRRFNVGVRWRHRGLAPRGFLHYGVQQAARDMGIDPDLPIYAQ